MDKSSRNTDPRLELDAAGPVLVVDVEEAAALAAEAHIVVDDVQPTVPLGCLGEQLVDEPGSTTLPGAASRLAARIDDRLRGALRGLSSRRSLATTKAPSDARRMADARPMPTPAPVTTTTLLTNRVIRSAPPCLFGPRLIHQWITPEAVSRATVESEVLGHESAPGA